jgi:hypothetical protein
MEHITISGVSPMAVQLASAIKYDATYQLLTTIGYSLLKQVYAALFHVFLA